MAALKKANQDKSVAMSFFMRTPFACIKAQGAEINYRRLHSQGGIGSSSTHNPNPASLDVMSCYKQTKVISIQGKLPNTCKPSELSSDTSSNSLLIASQIRALLQPLASQGP